MPARYHTVTFLSDFGTTDEFVGVVKSVIRDLAPHVTVVDLTHGIPAHDIRAGSLALARAVQYLAPGVILAVVDPGVGGDRRAVAVEVAGGQGVFVGPDNGLLASAVAMAGGAERAVSLTSTAHHLPAPGATFAGRDVFAPAAAHLCNGVPLDDLGEPVDASTLVPGLLPTSRQEGETLVAEVLWIDRYGNAQLNLGADDLAAIGEQVMLRVGESVRTAALAPSYGAIGPGQVGLVVDAYGLVSICLDRHPAAAELGLSEGDTVRLEPAGADATDDRPQPGAPVTLRSRARGR